jgi:hypothetical protein
MRAGNIFFMMSQDALACRADTIDTLVFILRILFMTVFAFAGGGGGGYLSKK